MSVIPINKLIEKAPYEYLHIGDKVKHKSTARLNVVGYIISLFNSKYAYVKWPSGLKSKELILDLIKEG